MFLVLQCTVSIIAIYNGRSGLFSYRKAHPRGRRRGPAPTGSSQTPYRLRLRPSPLTHSALVTSVKSHAALAVVVSSAKGTNPTSISTESANARTFLQVLLTNTILSSFRKSHTRICYHNTLTVSIFYFILHFFVQNTQPIRQ